MMWSAPARAARWPFSGLLTVVMTVASDHRASWMAALPTAPAPPATKTMRPSSVPGPRRAGPSSVTLRHRCAVRKGIPRLAPRSNEATSGRSTAWLAGDDACRRADAVLDEALADGAVGLDRLSVAEASGGRGRFSLRRILVHMIEEYARHNGHADLIREAIDGQTGE